MAGTSFKLDMKSMDKWFAKATAGLKLKQELSSSIGMAMVNSTLRRFETGTGPDGERWEPSARAEESGGQTLIDGGHLRDSITYEASSEQVVWGTNRIYGAIHQYGGEIRPKSAPKLFFNVGGQNVSTDKVDMPKREYLGWTEEDLEMAQDLMSDFIKQAMGIA